MNTTKTHQETEEIIYDDQYRISIPELIFNNRIDSKEDLQRLLDDNGYYGRATVHVKREFGHPTNLLYVKVLLVNSNYRYKWPLNSYYCTRTGKVLLVKRKVKPSPLILGGMKTLVGCVQNNKRHNIDVSELGVEALLAGYSNYGYANRSTIFNQLIHFNLLHENQLVLKDMDDVEELYYNLFDQKYNV